MKKVDKVAINVIIDDLKSDDVRKRVNSVK